MLRRLVRPHHVLSHRQYAIPDAILHVVCMHGCAVTRTSYARCHAASYVPHVVLLVACALAVSHVSPRVMLHYIRQVGLILHKGPLSVTLRAGASGAVRPSINRRRARTGAKELALTEQ